MQWRYWSLMAAMLTLAAPAVAAVEPECVANALMPDQVTALEDVISVNGIRRDGMEQASAILVPTGRICAATHGWSVDAANAGVDIALYRQVLRVAASARGMGPERAARLESWLAAENPDDVRRLSNSSMRGEERVRMLLRMTQALGSFNDMWTVTYIVARERLADRLERFAGL